MRKLLVTVAVLGAVLVAADFGLRLLADLWVGREIKTALSLSERPSVSLGGFPFIPELISGKVPSVTVRTRSSVTKGRLSVREVTLYLRDVSFSPRRLIAGSPTRIRAENGKGTAEFTEGDLNAALRASIPLTVRFRSGKVVIRADQSGLELVATPSISDGRLVLTPARPAIPRVVVDLPEVVDGITYVGVRIDGDTATLSFTLSKATFVTSGS